MLIPSTKNTYGKNVGVNYQPPTQWSPVAAGEDAS